jgi:hypothetical protein
MDKFRGDMMGKQMYGLVEKRVQRIKGESYVRGTTLVRFDSGVKEN